MQARSQGLAALLALLLLLTQPASRAHAARSLSQDAGQKPNIVLMLADDLGFDDIGFNNKDVITPNLDALRQDSCLFTNFYVNPSALRFLSNERSPFFVAADVGFWVRGEVEFISMACLRGQLPFEAWPITDRSYEPFGSTT